MVDILVLTIYGLVPQPERGTHVVVEVVDVDGVPALGERERALLGHVTVDTVVIENFFIVDEEG